MKIIETQIEKREMAKKTEAENSKLLRIQEAIKQETNKLNTVRAENTKAIEEHEDSFQKSFQEKAKKKAQLEVEVADLEKRRALLMQPLTSLENELNERHKQVIHLEAQVSNGMTLLNKRSKIFDQESEELAKDKLDVQYQKELNGRESARLKSFEAKLDSERAGLIEKMNDFEKQRQIHLSWLEDERAEIKRQQTEIEAKFGIIEQEKAEIEADKTKIKDQRLALDAAKKEIYDRS